MTFYGIGLSTVNDGGGRSKRIKYWNSLKDINSRKKMRIRKQLKIPSVIEWWQNYGFEVVVKLKFVWSSKIHSSFSIHSYQKYPCLCLYYILYFRRKLTCFCQNFWDEELSSSLLFTRWPSPIIQLSSVKKKRELSPFWQLSRMTLMFLFFKEEGRILIYFKVISIIPGNWMIKKIMLLCWWGFRIQWLFPSER